MSEINDGGPAFPVSSVTGSGAHFGMSLRAYFAGQMLCGISKPLHEGKYDRRVAAKWCVAVADAMIAELAKEAK